jgi:hypothetical protein
LPKVHPTCRVKGVQLWRTLRAAVDQAVLVGDLIEIRRIASSAAVRPLLEDLASPEDEQ